MCIRDREDSCPDTDGIQPDRRDRPAAGHRHQDLAGVLQCAGRQKNQLHDPDCDRRGQPQRCDRDLRGAAPVSYTHLFYYILIRLELQRKIHIPRPFLAAWFWRKMPSRGVFARRARNLFKKPSIL